MKFPSLAFCPVPCPRGVLRLGFFKVSYSLIERVFNCLRHKLNDKKWAHKNNGYIIRKLNSWPLFLCVVYTETWTFGPNQILPCVNQIPGFSIYSDVWSVLVMYFVTLCLWWLFLKLPPDLIKTFPLSTRSQNQKWDLQRFINSNRIELEMK